jgi:curved DNA-binding protein CbpA
MHDDPSFPDHYAALELPPTATADQIKSSFRRLAIKYHPDKQKPPTSTTTTTTATATATATSDTTAPFRQVREAYETLSDPNYRKA